MAGKPFFFLFSPDVRNRMTTEIEGELILIYNNLWRIRIEQDFRRPYFFNECSDHSAVIVKAIANQLNLLRINKRLVTLNVNNDVIRQMKFINDLCTTVC